MELLNKYKRIRLDQINVLRDDRQRRQIYDPEGKFINSDGLLESIRDRGVFNPVIVTDELVLVAGERRLEASRTLGLTDIPCRYISDLSPIEGKIVELEENLKRADLPWRDRVAAVAELHDAYCEQDPSWTAARTGKELNETNINIILRVAKDLDSPGIARAVHVREAFNILARKDERYMQDAANMISEAGPSFFDSPEEEAARGVPEPEPESIIMADFTKWAPEYVGPKFNFIHCDFPYGIGLYEGDQSGRTRWADTYDDEESSYEQLIEALCENLDRLLLPAGHLMFWLGADIHRQYWTLEQFRTKCPSLMFNTKPLVWHKTDNVGVLSDPKRGPRHVYETALFASREDRLIVRATSDCYGAPTDKSIHPSCKPEPVLRYFFQMFVDDNTQMLDPTCGSGSALRAAESLGAKQVFGLENNPEYLASARASLKSFRTLRKVTL